MKVLSSKAVHSLALRELARADLKEAARLLSRGMCNNPANVRAFGIGNVLRRQRALARFFVPVLHGLYRRGVVVGAFHEGTLVGVCGMARPTLCQPGVLEKLSVVPSVVLANPVSAPLGVLRWVGEWARRDPTEPHWHLGPLAVDSHLQGLGIGSAMLAAFCERMDGLRALSYLETDKSENVRFYQRFGFTVIAEAVVVGVRCWFMSRRPNRSDSLSANL